MIHIPDHPEIRSIQLTGYPTWLNNEDAPERDEDFESERGDDAS